MKKPEDMTPEELQQELRDGPRRIAALEREVEADRQFVLRMLAVEKAGTWTGLFPLQRVELLQDLASLDQRQASIAAAREAWPIPPEDQ